MQPEIIFMGYFVGQILSATPTDPPDKHYGLPSWWRFGARPAHMPCKLVGTARNLYDAAAASVLSPRHLQEGEKHDHRCKVDRNLALGGWDVYTAPALMV